MNASFRDQLQPMTAAERVELLMIGVAAGIGWLAWPLFSAVFPLWQVVLGLSALLLAQSLVRDVTILLRQRSAPGGPRREAQCVCLESSVGSAGIVAAAVLSIMAGSIPVSIGRWGFAMAIAGILLLGFAIKNLVISWNPLGLHRERG
jgi:hypothetical protein